MLDCQLFGLNAGGASFRQRPASRGQRRCSLFLLLPTDECALAQRVCGRAVCVASAACGIGCVGFGTQRRVEHVFRVLTLLSYARFVASVQGSKPTIQSLLRFGAADFALGLMSKPMLVTLPFVLLLLDFWPLNRLHTCAQWPESAGVLDWGCQKWSVLMPLLAASA